MRRGMIPMKRVPMFEKAYIKDVLRELEELGYKGDSAKETLLRNYRVMKRSLGFGPNAMNFAREIDELQKRREVKYDSSNPDHIYIGHLKEKIKRIKRK